MSVIYFEVTSYFLEVRQFQSKSFCKSLDLVDEEENVTSERWIKSHS